jgi:two-component system cell cycle response regulator
MTDPAVERLLAWERGLLRSASLERWLAAARRPSLGAGDVTVSVVLADPNHELKQLVAGNSHDHTSPIVFVDSLAGLAPHLLTLHGAWRGEFRAADHGLLFPGAQGLHEVLLLPLPGEGGPVGLYGVGTRADEGSLESLPAALLDHLADVLLASLDRHLDRARLQRGGMVDPLTGWHSPRYLRARLGEEIARCQRQRGDVACLIVDVDRLQALNEECGQLAGDRALREIAARIESQVRASDTAARLGGDSFVIVLPATDARHAAPLAERILLAVRGAAIEVGGGVRRGLRVSIGIAGGQPASADDRKTFADQLLAAALAALHRAKRSGGDRFEIAPH